MIRTRELTDASGRIFTYGYPPPTGYSTLFFGDDASDANVLNGHGLRSLGADGVVSYYANTPPETIKVGTGYDFETIAQVSTYLNTLPKCSRLIDLQLYGGSLPQTNVFIRNQLVQCTLMEDVSGNLSFQFCPYVHLMGSNEWTWRGSMDFLSCQTVIMNTGTYAGVVIYVLRSSLQLLDIQLYDATLTVEQSSTVTISESTIRETSFTATGNSTIYLSNSCYLKNCSYSPAVNVTGNTQSLIIVEQ